MDIRDAVARYLRGRQSPRFGYAGHGLGAMRFASNIREDVLAGAHVPRDSTLVGEVTSAINGVLEEPVSRTIFNNRLWLHTSGPDVTYQSAYALGRAWRTSSEHLGTATRSVSDGWQMFTEGAGRTITAGRDFASDVVSTTSETLRSTEWMQLWRALVDWWNTTGVRCSSAWRRSVFSQLTRLINLANLGRPELLSATCTLLIEGCVTFAREEINPIALTLVELWRCLGSMRVIRDAPTGFAHANLEARVWASLHKMTGLCATSAIIISSPHIPYMWSGTVYGIIGGAYVLSVIKRNRSWVVETVRQPIHESILDAVHKADQAALMLAHTNSPQKLDGYHSCSIDCADDCGTRVQVYDTYNSECLSVLPCIILARVRDDILYMADIAVELKCVGDWTVCTRKEGKHVWFQPRTDMQIGNAFVSITDSHINIVGQFGRERVPLAPVVSTAYGVSDLPREMPDEIRKLKTNMRSMLMARLGAEKCMPLHPEVVVLLVAQLSDAIYVNFSHELVRSAGSYNFYARAWYNLFDVARGTCADTLLSRFVQKYTFGRRIMPWKYVCKPIPQYTMFMKHTNTRFSPNLPGERKPFRDEGARGPATANDRNGRDTGEQPRQHGGIAGNARPQPSSSAEPTPDRPAAPEPDHGSLQPDNEPEPPNAGAEHAAPPDGGGLHGCHQHDTHAESEEVREPAGPQGGDAPDDDGAGDERHDDRGHDDVQGDRFTWDGRDIPAGEPIEFVDTLEVSAHGARIVLLEYEGRDVIQVGVCRQPTWTARVRTNLIVRAFAGYSVEERADALRRFDTLVKLSGHHESTRVFTRVLRHFRDCTREGLTPSQSVARISLRVLGVRPDGMAQRGHRAHEFRRMGEEVPGEEAPGAGGGSARRADARTPPSEGGGEDHKFHQDRNECPTDRPEEHRSKNRPFHGRARAGRRGRGKEGPQSRFSREGR